MLKSTKLPAATGTLPVAVQLPPEAGEHASVVFAIFPGVPTLSVTVISFDCFENTVSVVAVQADGTHVCTEGSSDALALLLFTE
jgi:hypothetical protein